MKSDTAAINKLVEQSKNNPITKNPGMRFVATGEGMTAEPFTPTPEQVKEAEKHFAELEKQWGVKFEPWPPVKN